MGLLSKKAPVIQRSRSQIAKLNRVSGQIEGIKRMIESDRESMDVLIQLKSARAAIRAIEANLLITYLQENTVKAFKNEKEKEQTISKINSLFSNVD